MCECNHRHSPSKRAGSWQAVKEFWEPINYSQEKEWHCATCGLLIEKPKAYNKVAYLQIFFIPVLYCLCTKIIALLAKVFPSIVVMATCNIAALYLILMLGFRLFPAIVLSFGKWTLAIPNQDDGHILKTDKEKNESFIKLKMLLFGLTFGAIILFA